MPYFKGTAIRFALIAPHSLLFQHPNEQYLEIREQLKLQETSAIASVRSFYDDHSSPALKGA
jgi:hypothetical protein